LRLTLAHKPLLIPFDKWGLNN